MEYTKSNLKREYLKQSVLTASPTELIVMLFDSCIKNLKLAEICLLERKDLNSTHTHLIKSQKIILELINCLDTSYELSAQLLELYDYLLFAIREMNAKKDLRLLPDVLTMLVSLRDTWQQIANPRFTCSSEVS